MGPNLYVAKAPGLPWNFSNYGDMKAGYACASAGVAPPEGDVTLVPTTVPPECAPPPPPTGVPTKDEALAKTGDLLKALGVDAGSLALTANASEWSADVQGVPSLGGIATPSLTMSFGFGGEGKLQYANGFLIAPDKADSYPRIGTTKAFDELKAGNGIMGWFAYGGPMMRNNLAVGSTGPATTAIAPSDSGSGFAACATDGPLDPTNGAPPPEAPTTTMPVCTTSTAIACLVPTPPPSAVGDKGIATAYPSCGPTPCTDVAVTSVPDTAPAGAATSIATSCPQPLPMPEPTTPPEPVTITIAGVHETLVPFTGADGSMWLMPGYEFTSADGGAWPTLAIDKSFVDQVAPTQPMPEPAVATAVEPATTSVAGG
jgi:hypothetical protein